MKKLFSLFLSACLLFAAPPQYALGENNNDYASLTVGKYYKTHNVSNYYFGENDGTFLVERLGRTGVQMYSENPSTLFLYINADDNVFYSPEGSNIKVIVDYFDEGTSNFTLRYCSTGQQWNDDNDIVKLTDSKIWKQHVFYLKDATMDNRCNNADIVVAMWSRNMPVIKQQFIVGGVRIEKEYQPVKETVTSAHVGNIFAPEDDMTLNLHMENTTGGKFDTEIKLDVYDRYNSKIKSISGNVTLDGEDADFEIRPEITVFGTYTLKGTVSYADENNIMHNDEIEERFSLADKLSPSDPRNDRFGVCSHVWRYASDELEQKHKEVLQAMGAGWHRTEVQWARIESELLKYTFPRESGMPFQMKEYGVNSLQILDYGNTLYKDSHGEENTIPTTDEYIEGYIRYCLKTLEYYKGMIEYVEIWNEPDNYKFNVEWVPPSAYAELVKRVAPAIKAEYPDIKIVGPVTCDTKVEWVKGFFDAGGYDYIDCVSFHPYQWNGRLEMDVLRGKMNEIRNLMSQYGEMKPVWITEIGWSSTIGGERKYSMSRTDRPGVSLQTYTILIGEGLADKVFWYNFQDSGVNISNGEANMGMVTNPTGGVTPWAADNLYIMFTQMNKKIGPADPAGFIRRSDETCLYNFKRHDGGNVMVAWSEGESRAVGMKLGGTRLDKYDIYGNKIDTICSDNGVFLISAEKEPVYYVGNFDSFEEAQCDISVTQNPYITGAGESFEFKAEDKRCRKLRTEAECGLETEAGGGDRVYIKTPADETGEYEFTARVYADDLLVYSGKNILSTKTMQTSISLQRAAGNYYKAVLTIANNMNNTKLSGTVRLKIAGAEKEQSRPVRFVDIPPGGSMSFETALPEMVKKRPFTIITEAETDSGYKYSKSEDFDLISAQCTDKKPDIDGRISKGEWNGSWIAADTKSAVVNTPDWGGAADASFSANLMWDNENLYMAVIVKDNVFCQGYTNSDVWQGDSLQFAFSDPKKEKTDASICTAMSIALTNYGTEVRRGLSDYGAEACMLSLNASAVRSEDGIIYELEIPWKEIFYEGYIPKAGESIGFSLLMNDNDGAGRRGGMQYGEGIYFGRDFNKFKDLKLIK
ncbi:MAG: hypothetical protein J6N52_07140 [Clostridia bacterium]|nr:hypothetical protein [Clostridia bacterium]